MTASVVIDGGRIRSPTWGSEQAPIGATSPAVNPARTKLTDYIRMEIRHPHKRSWNIDVLCRQWREKYISTRGDVEEIAAQGWVPSSVLAMANYLADATGDGPPEVRDLLRRLITDEQMRGVWQDLQKHKRDGYAPTAAQFYKAGLPGAVQSWAGMAAAWRSRAADYRDLGDEATAAQYEGFASAADARQASSQSVSLDQGDEHELVLALIFALAFSLYCAGLEMVKRTDIEQRIASLRADGEAEAADAFRRQAQISENSRFNVVRKRGDQRIHAFMEGMAKEMRAMFGQDMPGAIATITNVAFERSDYGRDRIRALLEIRP
jgi:hypothetical protein